MRGLALRERLKLMGKAAVGLFDTNAAEAAHGLLAGIFSGTSGPSVPRATAELLNTFNTSPWVQACATRVADALSSVHWKLYVVRSKQTGKLLHPKALQRAPTQAIRQQYLKAVARDAEPQEIENHLMLDVLRDPNSLMTGEELRWLGALYADLAGEEFLIKERNGLGAPTGLWPIPPHWIQNTPTPSFPFFRASWQGWHAQIPHTEMLWLPRLNPFNPYGRGSGLVKSLDDEVAIDEFSAKHTLAFFRNNARPDVIIHPKEGGTINDVERDRLEQWWVEKLQGHWRRFKPLFLSRPMEIKTLEQNFRNMQLTELRQAESNTIMQVWGVNPELFGRLESSNRATITQALQMFARVVLIPRLERRRAWLQTRLVPEYDPRLILEYESPVPEDREFKLDVMKAAPWNWTGNEWRELAGDTPDDEMAEVRMQPFNMVPFGESRMPADGGDPDLSVLSDGELAQLYILLDKAAKEEVAQ